MGNMQRAGMKSPAAEKKESSMQVPETFFTFRDFTWDKIRKHDYKQAEQEGTCSFRDVTRQVLSEGFSDLKFEVRYFEAQQGGYTTLEKHDHAHFVIAARGQGYLILDGTVTEFRPNDAFYIPGGAVHQLVNTGEGPMGFFCMVNADRDPYRLLDKQEFEDFLKTPAGLMAKYPDNYEELAVVRKRELNG